MQQNTYNNITAEENNKPARHKQSRKQHLENICQGRQAATYKRFDLKRKKI